MKNIRIEMKRHLQKLVTRPLALVRGDMKKWYDSLGVEFLERIGVCEGDVVIDFGCRVGHYSIPAAMLTGSTGNVLAIDKNASALAKLRHKAEQCGVGNVHTFLNNGDVTVDLPEGSADVVLIYDVLHMMERQVRAALYTEVGKVLKPGGLLSVHASHSKDFIPNRYFSEMTIEDVQHEIQASGLLYKATVWGRITHDNGLVESGVMNFRKKATVKEEIQ